MKNILVLLTALLIPLSTQALFELRAGYGTVTLDEDVYLGNSFDNPKGFNLDLLIEPPLFTDLGFGVRYEKMAMDYSRVGASGEADLERISAIVNYRFIDLFAYLGVIGTVGLSNSFETTESGVTNSTWEEKLNYSIGVEGGVSLGLIQVGAEVGKLFAEMENPGQADLDISGIYIKALVGVGF